MSKVYSIDLSGAGETKILNFTNPLNPSQEQFEKDIRAALEEGTKTKRGWLSAAVNKLEKLHYVKATTIVYEMGSGEVFTEEANTSVQCQK